jgi:hypothetical protein
MTLPLPQQSVFNVQAEPTALQFVSSVPQVKLAVQTIGSQQSLLVAHEPPEDLHDGGGGPPHPASSAVALIKTLKTALLVFSST